MTSSGSSASIPKDIKDNFKALLRYCELQDEEIRTLESKAKWLLRSQIAILLYLIFI